MPRLRAPLLLSVLLSSVALAPAAEAAAPPARSGQASAVRMDLEQVRRGVVQIEQNGRPMAVGTVLSKDGRVLTALSALASAAQVDVRYADGAVVKAKLAHADKAWDLALLVPQSGKWLDGLVPSDADPAAVELRAFLPKGGRLADTRVAFKRRVDARAREGAGLRGALEVDLAGAGPVPGAPLLDADGKVVGMLVRACEGPASKLAAVGEPPGAEEKASARRPCAPLAVGAPVTAIRSFLMKTPEDAVQPAPWLGLGGVATEAGTVKGIRVMGVAPGSPAEQAGLVAGDAPDTIVAVDGTPVETPEQLAELVAARAVGQTVKLLVFRGATFREVAVTLRAAP